MELTRHFSRFKAGTPMHCKMLASRLPLAGEKEAIMNARILYAGVPLAIAMLSGPANAQTVVAPALTQDQQTTVYRTIVRENAIPQTQTVRKQSRQIIRQSRQVIRKPTGNVVRTTTTERVVTR